MQFIESANIYFRFNWHPVIEPLRQLCHGNQLFALAWKFKILFYQSSINHMECMVVCDERSTSHWITTHAIFHICILFALGIFPSCRVSRFVSLFGLIVCVCSAFILCKTKHTLFSLSRRNFFSISTGVRFHSIPTWCLARVRSNTQCDGGKKNLFVLTPI